jgi:hypothetical protein
MMFILAQMIEISCVKIYQIRQFMHSFAGGLQGKNIIYVLFHVICHSTQQAGMDITGENIVKNI